MLSKGLTYGFLFQRVTFGSILSHILTGVRQIFRWISVEQCKSACLPVNGIDNVVILVVVQPVKAFVLSHEGVQRVEPLRFFYSPTLRSVAFWDYKLIFTRLFKLCTN